MDTFLLHAVIGGAGVALLAGPLGCFLVWRRMAYFGAALSHSALLGVAMGFLLGMNLTLAILLFCLALAMMLLLLERQHMLASDTLLGILAHGSLALGLVVVAFLRGLRIDLMGYLFGDVLAIGPSDLALIGALVVAGGLLLTLIWRPLLAVTVNEDLAAVEGMPVVSVRVVYVLLVASIIAVGMKVVGILLVISLLIIPAAAARRFASTPEQMAIGAAGIGVVSVVLGLAGSYQADVPSGPSIVVVAVIVFALSFGWPSRLGRQSV